MLWQISIVLLMNILNRVERLYFFVSVYSKKYEKFVVIDDVHKSTSMDFISKKILYTILAVLLSIISNILKFKMFSFFQIFISFLFGFFILDVFLKIREKKEKLLVKTS